jgi:uncharacterized protein YecE (DUF72 family)
VKAIYIGTSGFNYKHWKKRFYPEEIKEKEWLEYYVRYFNSVEINATFYGHFQKKVFENWNSRTPSGFAFTLKGPRFITHIKRLKDPKESLDYFFDAAVGLGDKLSLVLWQFSPGFKLTDETYQRFKDFLGILPKDINQTVEFRNRTWFEEKVYKLLNKHGVGFVINDSSRWPDAEQVTGKLAYVRFHGPRQLYGSEYTDEELSDWSKKIKVFAKDREVYCYFNNDGNAYAVKNARELMQKLGVVV